MIRVYEMMTAKGEKQEKEKNRISCQSFGRSAESVLLLLLVMLLLMLLVTTLLLLLLVLVVDVLLLFALLISLLLLLLVMLFSPLPSGTPEVAFDAATDVGVAPVTCAC
jgi:uncharacterized membrane protein